jgi:Rps23 Pro-64 3,4-dihydroxylase Tpa1-like proline 4-hydroxylase
MKLLLNKTNKIEPLKQSYLEHGYVKVPNALSTNSANLIYSSISKQEQWNLVFRSNNAHQDLNNLNVENWDKEHIDNLIDLIHKQAEAGFQYFYETIPIYDIYYDKLMLGHFFNDIFEFINSDETLAFFRKMLNAPEITFADAQITRFRAGHFLNQHNDDVNGKNRVAAFVINLTKDWRVDWGGELHLFTDNFEIKKSFVPSFNEINIFKVPVKHLVGYVSPFATGNRLSITGWFRSGKNPKII